MIQEAPLTLGQKAGSPPATIGNRAAPSGGPKERDVPDVRALIEGNPPFPTVMIQK